MNIYIKLKMAVLVLGSTAAISSCANYKTDKNPEKQIAESVPTQKEIQSQKIINDKYVGSWIDITRDPNDTSEIFTITKLHDYEYQIGSLKGELKQLVNGAEYLSVWSEEYGAEMQFIFDDYTKHLMLRTSFFSKELRNMNEH